MFKKVLAGAALAIIAVLAVPAAAQAYSITPPPNTSAGAGETFSATFTGFSSGEDVSIALTGESASSATLAAVVTAVETKTIVKAADAAGDVTVTVTLPSNASGSYTLTATGLTSGAIGQSTITAVSSSAAGGSGSGATGGLPNTGAMDPTLGIWAGGGLLALGAAFVIVLTVVRRQKATN